MKEIEGEMKIGGLGFEFWEQGESEIWERGE
jgi:hypothetical protein